MALPANVGLGGGDESEEEEERKCPVCGKKWVKTEPTLAEVRTAIRESFMAHEGEYKDLADDVEAGYCGSVATGKVGNEEKPHYGHEPDIRGECGTKYDVDGFVISDFGKKMKKRGSKRWGYSHKKTRDIEKHMRATLKGKAALAHMKGGKDGFSLVVYLQKERSQPINKGGIILIF